MAHQFAVAGDRQAFGAKKIFQEGERGASDGEMDQRHLRGKEVISKNFPETEVGL
jgi:hypothetical protein